MRNKEKKETAAGVMPIEGLAGFKEEMAELQRKEQSGEIKTGHFLHSNFDPEKLTAEDMEIWEKVKDRSITRDDWDKYSASVIVLRRELGNFSSREIFRAFIGNKATGIFLRRELDNGK